MATATKSKSSKSSKGKTAKSQGSKATSQNGKAKTQDGPSKREAQKARDAEYTTTILERRGNGDKWGEIASDLNITPGKAQFLFMLHEVAEGNVPAIRHRNENELVTGIRKAREANNQYSSWGWIAARTGVSEGKIKALAEEAGIPVKGTNVAVARSEANGGKAKGDGKTRTQATTKGTGKASSKAAKAKAKAKKSGNA